MACCDYVIVARWLCYHASGRLAGVGEDPTGDRRYTEGMCICTDRRFHRLTGIEVLCSSILIDRRGLSGGY